MACWLFTVKNTSSLVSQLTVVHVCSALSKDVWCIIVALSVYRNYMNDSFRSVVFVKYQPETIACACIFLAARQLQIPLPNSPPWYAIFSVDHEEIVDICVQILNLYVRPKVSSQYLNNARKPD